ncbi:hypothetical protein A3D88_01715 [Candidatus Peribacteria bacterium RIFCSPHIGHO2_02_FULL_52_16]|nr:MAG: hypothetical protein A2706_03955 [Candidatus Peribacteria bacterium RIFCSPHIGHO2_01_FULL_51_35]OGJ61037.1 MAG: hypothetical protein A3D88_01715 [Candidatus Peribacteria bacterium RIFCSPHIGHO2_02_FULL_52_16]
MTKIDGPQGDSVEVNGLVGPIVLAAKGELEELTTDDVMPFCNSPSPELFKLLQKVPAATAAEVKS